MLNFQRSKLQDFLINQLQGDEKEKKVQNNFANISFS